ncbi:MAG: hypothetical protein ABR583_06495 [Gaiellaceae bacterium]
MRALAVAAITLTVAGAAGQARPAAPRTIITARGPITAFAQDGRFLAWATEERGRRCARMVRLRDVARGRERVLTQADRPTCRSVARVNELAVAAGPRGASVLWKRFETGNFAYHWLSSASFSEPRERDLGPVAELVHDDLRVSLAGDSSFLGYGWSHSGNGECLAGGCSYTIQKGGVTRIVAGKPAPVPAVPPTALVATDGTHLVLLVRGAVGERTKPSAPLRRVEVREAATGRLVRALESAGSVRGLAIDGDHVALLTAGAIELHSVAGGRQTTVAVSARATGLSLAGTRIVFRVGRSIRLLGGGELARAAATPIGFSLEGGRLAWAENVKGRGRIRTLALP